ncbi:MAG: hypothetical protein GY847_06870 [Proteobacteria bacterium]|nr:hypothetical protein [Pseudomonadota bacterium]
MTDKPKETRSIMSVPVWLLLTIILTFVAGVVACLIADSLSAADGVTLSTTSVISFSFTVALGAASIILAALTIVLSRTAEDALINRSDEGIRLQNAVFVKTSEVLSAIQASTGVTEKRLEDIISGRTGVIAQQVFERSFPDGEGSLSAEAIDRLKKSLAKSLSDELRPLLASRPEQTQVILSEMEERQRKLQDGVERWDAYRLSIVAAVGKQEDVEIVSQSKGSTGAETMEKFWDAVIELEGKRMGLDIHILDQLGEYGVYSHWIGSLSLKKEFARRITWRAWEDKIDVLFWIWDESISNHREMLEIADLVRRGLRNTDFVLLYGDAENVAKGILTYGQ